VWVRCDTMLKIIKELDENTELQDIFGNPVSAALTVVAENGDLRIEDGGLADLSEEQKERFVSILGRILTGGRQTAHSGTREGGERIRIRCDVLGAIIRELDRNNELRAIFGGAVSEALIVVAEGDDLRIEVGDAVKLTDGQSSVFLGILNRVVEEKQQSTTDPRRK